MYMTNAPLNWPASHTNPQFNEKVLIYNWCEERRRFQKGNVKHNSTHRNDFTHPGNPAPDVELRRRAPLVHAGLPAPFITHHHGKRYLDNNNITWYDEQYSKRGRDIATEPLKLRHWDKHRCVWAPEAVDTEVQGKPTNFGLLENLETKWRRENKLQRKEYESTYTGTYLGPPATAPMLRQAIPRTDSSHLNKYNKINKDLHLRGSNYLTAPEPLPVIKPAHQTTINIVP